MNVIAMNQPEAQVRFAAHRIGLIAVKSEDRHIHDGNQGAWRLLSAQDGSIVIGEDYDWPSEWVVDYCQKFEECMVDGNYRV